MSETVEMPLEISVEQVKEMLDQQADFLLLDCREPAEFEICRLQGSQLIPLNDIPQRLDYLTQESPGHVIVMCHHGTRSLMAARWLRKHGVENAQSMSGGIDEWSLKIDRSVPRY